MGVAMTIGRRRFRGGDYNIARHENGGLKCFTAQWQSEAAYSPALEA
jgi:hypothetical protein